MIFSISEYPSYVGNTEAFTCTSWVPKTAYRISYKQAGIFLIMNIGVHHSPQSVRKMGGPRHQGRVAPFVVPLTMFFVSKQLGGTRASNVDANKRPQPPRTQTDLLLKAGMEGRGGDGL